MAVKKLYIQQTSFDGISYTKGNVIETISAYHIGCEAFPFSPVSDTKDLPTKDYPGESGVKTYIPDELAFKAYDVDVSFIYTGPQTDFYDHIASFLQYISGRSEGSVGARLSIFDEHVSIGRKDVVFKGFDPQAYYNDDSDDEVAVRFKVKFNIGDPVTEVKPVIGEDGIVTDLNF